MNANTDTRRAGRPELTVEDIVAKIKSRKHDEMSALLDAARVEFLTRIFGRALQPEELLNAHHPKLNSEFHNSPEHEAIRPQLEAILEARRLEAEREENERTAKRANRAKKSVAQALASELDAEKLAKLLAMLEAGELDKVIG